MRHCNFVDKGILNFWIHANFGTIATKRSIFKKYHNGIIPLCLDTLCIFQNIFLSYLAVRCKDEKRTRDGWVLSAVNHNYPTPNPKHLLRTIIVGNNDDFDKQRQFSIKHNMNTHSERKNGEIMKAKTKVIRKRYANLLNISFSQ